MVVTEQAITWRELAWTEIRSIKSYLIEKYAWEITFNEDENRIFLYVRMQHQKDAKNVKVLRLEYGPNFPNERPRENFANPSNFDEIGTQYWIRDNEQAFKAGRNPPVICLPGTWGFHHDLHKERDPLQANLNQLLRDVQICFNRTT